MAHHAAAAAELAGRADEDWCPPLPAGVDRADVQGPEDGAGPLFHRRYRVRVRHARLSAQGAMARLQADPDAAAPSEFATFRKRRGRDGGMDVGDEYVVRMAGPWDGPVRVIERSDTAFRLVTLRGHLEAGQIEFATADIDGHLEIRIESWARSGDRVADVLYSRLRMAKEVQLHMWTSFLERVVALAGGRRTGALEVVTRRVDDVGHVG